MKIERDLFTQHFTAFNIRTENFIFLAITLIENNENFHILFLYNNLFSLKLNFIYFLLFCKNTALFENSFINQKITCIHSKFLKTLNFSG